MVTAKDVAQRAGVSQATVSYVMSGRRPISEETKQRVIQAMQELGYYPNSNARALAAHRTEVIGVVVRLDENTQMAELLPYLSTILADLNQQGYSVTLIPADEGMDRIKKSAAQSQVDGLLVFDIEWHDERLPELRKLGTPTVLIGSAEDTGSLSSVDVDYARIAQLTMNELMDAGAQHIIYVGDLGRDADRYAFSRSFAVESRNAANILGLGYDLFIPSVPGWQGIWNMKDLLLRYRDQHCGIAVRTPQNMDWVVQLMIELGITPSAQDMPLVAVCADSYAQQARIPVSNVDPMAQDIAHTAIERLLHIIEHNDRTATRTLIIPRVTKRSTT